MRIFGLIYGIIRINVKPKQLAQILDKYCNWNYHFPVGFKVGFEETGRGFFGLGEEVGFFF